ncbi:MAG TPA: AAA-associated domain-containing protein [Nitrososphaerales archaeon]|nr:AAA-associated domain-containing protein [Nitrososphaerales archaeon]
MNTILLLQRYALAVKEDRGEDSYFVKLPSKKLENIDANLLEGDVRKGMFPSGIEPGQLIEVGRALASQDSGADVVKLTKILGAKPDEIQSIINACQMLGFVRIRDGLISITDRVNELNALPRSKKKQYLTERLSLVEPFKTSIEVAQKSQSFSSDKVADLLYKKELRWAEEEELNTLLVHDILVDWAIFSGLLQYDGRSRMFSPKR